MSENRIAQKFRVENGVCLIIQWQCLGIPHLWTNPNILRVIYVLFIAYYPYYTIYTYNYIYTYVSHGQNC